MDGLRHAKSGTRQQSEECIVSMPSKGIAFTQLRCCLEDALDFGCGKDIGNGSRPVLTAEDWGRHLVVWVFRTDVPRKSDHLAKPPSSRRQQ